VPATSLSPPQKSINPPDHAIITTFDPPWKPCPCQGAEAIFPTYPVVAFCLPPANFSNRFAVKHTIHNFILQITMLAIDIPRALNLSMNQL
jgi:hypothetical protein